MTYSNLRETYFQHLIIAPQLLGELHVKVFPIKTQENV